MSFFRQVLFDNDRTSFSGEHFIICRNAIYDKRIVLHVDGISRNANNPLYQTLICDFGIDDNYIAVFWIRNFS